MLIDEAHAFAFTLCLVGVSLFALCWTRETEQSPRWQRQNNCRRMVEGRIKPRGPLRGVHG